MFFGWEKEQLGKASGAYMIDVDSHGQPCLVLHPKIKKKTNNRRHCIEN